MHHLARAILILALLAPPATAGGDRPGADGPGGLRPGGFSGAGRGAEASRRLEAFAAQRRFEARVRLTRTQRDSQRRAEEMRLRQSGSHADLAAYRQRIEREDDLDRRRLDSELAQLHVTRHAAPLGPWWNALGPATRRAFLRSGLDWQPAAQERERERRLQALERDIEEREAQAASGPFAPAELP
jgi:hypothetical protein